MGVRMAFAASLFLLASLSGPSGLWADAQAPGPVAAFKAGLEAFSREEWEEARDRLTEARGRFPLLADYVLFFLAEAQRKTGNLEEALAAYSALILQHPESRWVRPARLAWADLLVLMSQPLDGARVYEEFLAQGPGRADGARALFGLGEALELAGQHLAAAETYRRLWLLHPENRWADEAAVRLRQLESSAEVVLPPPSAEERYGRALRLLDARQWGRAVQELEAIRTAAIDFPRMAELRLRLALARWNLGKQREALGDLASLLAGSPPPRVATQALLEQARFYARQNRWEDGVSALRRLVKSYPSGGSASVGRYLIGRYLEELGRSREAASVYRQLLKSHPDHDRAMLARWHMAWIHYRAGSSREAQQEFARLDRDGVPSSLRRAGLYWAGRVAEARGRRKEAQAQWKKILMQAPQSYYGIMAARRLGVTPTGSEGPIFPVSHGAEEEVVTDSHFTKARALWELGFSDHGRAEVELAVARSVADKGRLWGLTRYYHRVGETAPALRVIRRFFSDIAHTGIQNAPPLFWRVLYPLDYMDAIKVEADRNGLDPLFVTALIREESGFNPGDRSPAGALGLMQLMPQTFTHLAREMGETLMDGAVWRPDVNIRLGTRYLAGLMKRFGGQVALAVAGYNAGPNKVTEWWKAHPSGDIEEWIEAIPYDETRLFVKRVLTSWEAYRKLYGKEPWPSPSS